MYQKMSDFLREEDALTIVEYAVAAGLITATLIGTMTALGISINGVINLVIGFITP